MAHTFADLGIPFPLFEAPLTDASGYLGLSRCFFCTREPVHCFAVGSTNEVMISCHYCGKQNGLQAHQGSAKTCWSCGQKVLFPASVERLDELKVCYDCLRAGTVALAKDTLYGLVQWKHAREGQTGGTPGWSSTAADVELIPLEDEQPSEGKPEARFQEQDEISGTGFVLLPSEEQWFAARISSASLFELLHTPNYGTWQGEKWLFCCQQPMIFMGSWQQEDFERHASDGNGRVLFEQLLPDVPHFFWDGNALASGAVGAYVFRCSTCEKLAAHWDAS